MAFGLSASCTTIWANIDLEQKTLQPIDNPSARGCHPSLRNDLLPMCPGSDTEPLVPGAGFEPATFGLQNPSEDSPGVAMSNQGSRFYLRFLALMNEASAWLVTSRQRSSVK